jgi:hypothetical protein
MFLDSLSEHNVKLNKMHSVEFYMQVMQCMRNTGFCGLQPAYIAATNSTTHLHEIYS